MATTDSTSGAPILTAPGSVSWNNCQALLAVREADTKATCPLPFPLIQLRPGLHLERHLGSCAVVRVVPLRGLTS